ncbi:5-oxoprolinase subunit PxpB [Aquamicrobium sp. LC103]|uniref:5-oxoprolinase subunit PxpB n=1 Tax=Aquamicrobium sp. LC103 TaxID=1120658 RepID=UPI00063EB636|nr:5-oxoprolinase subunit PxpB [Aquamicrobium sp. LC103]TKT69592.1 5-oxoprolinase subunit PxpB [Aquamicrobium sp. LC103]
MTPTIHPCGDSALMLQLGDKIDAEANARIIALAARIEAAGVMGVGEVVPTYRSLLLRYDPERIRGAEVERMLLRGYEGLSDTETAGRHWTVPVVYGGEVGQDIEEMALAKGLTPDEMVALHSGAEYRVYMIGFAPGFAYLGGLPEILHTQRLATPRQNIPAGAIGIGGQQASINSVAGPSGWRFIGWTPVKSFDPTRPEPFLFRAGDRIRFRAVEVDEGKLLAERIEAGEAVIEPEAAA